VAAGEVTFGRDEGAARNTTAQNMAVFIDADNLNDPTALDHVLTTLRSKADRVLYKRAYGRTESLKGIEAVLWRHGVRPVANMIVNKVTTDSALVIDAVEAVCTHSIDAIAICSGDADFVPLATWMRERGCHVFCFSLANKIFANPEIFYDEVVLLEVVEKTDSDAMPRETGPEKITPEAAMVHPEATHAFAVSKLPEPPERPVGPRALPPVQSQSHIDIDMVEQVLTAFPALRSGEPQHLSQVVAALRQQGILAKSTKTTVWFAQWAATFYLLPQPVPNQIVYQKPRGAVHLHATPRIAQALPLQLAAGLPDEVVRVLKALPDLHQGPQMLSQVVPVLRQKTILGKTTKSTAFFARHAAHFKLTPAHQPTQLAYIPPGFALAPC